MASRSRGFSADKMKEYAQAGAEEALRRLRAEIVAIERAFPELALPKRRRAARRAARNLAAKTRTMSDAARKAVSQRMKRYWAERRRANAKTK